MSRPLSLVQLSLNIPLLLYPDGKAKNQNWGKRAPRALHVCCLSGVENVKIWMETQNPF
jgi:hypothetical protein